MKKQQFQTIFFLYICLSSFISCTREKEVFYHIGVSQCSDDMWRQTMNDEMQVEASRHSNIKLDIKSVKDDTKQQIKDIGEFIEQKVDLLIISPNESAAITPIVKKAYESNIPVILVDRKIDSDDWTSYIGADNYQIGKEAGVYIANVLEGKGNVVIMRGWNGSTSDKERYAGFVETISDYPDIKIVKEAWGNFLKDEAKLQMNRLLQDKVNADLIFALNDPMALGVYEAALNYSGRIPFIVGIDALPGEGGGIENIEKGLIDASFIYPTGGDQAVSLGMNILEGRPFKRENILHTAVIDKSNVRVVQLQINEFLKRQNKITETNELLNKKVAQYSNQQTLIYGAFSALLVIIFLFLLAIASYFKVRKSNNLLKRQKEQMEKMSKELEELTNNKLNFFTNVSHEFKTPLTLILGPIESMLENGNISSKEEYLLRMMKRNGTRLQNLLSQVIEFRRYENSKMNPSFEKEYITNFITDRNISFTEYAKSRKINFVFETDLEETYTVDIDKDKLERIYFNILSNAFKHTKEDGLIKVSLVKTHHKTEEHIKISIFNDGDIIPQDKIKLIFDRFYKVNSNDSGTGLGLALTSALVEIHRGEIFVRSTKQDGTVFEILLPKNQEYYTTATTTPFSIIDQIQEQLRIEIESTPSDTLPLENDPGKDLLLIIEDNVDMRSYLRYILNDKYNLIEAEDGEEGIELAIKYVPDVIISDVMMAKKDGFETCKELKGNTVTSHIPVLMLTACSMDEQKTMGYYSGADAYISKPFSAKLLEACLQSIVDNRKKMKEAFSSDLIHDSLKNSLLDKELQFIEQFQEYVMENIADSQLNVNDIARNMGLSRSQLYRKIKSLVGYSPNEHIRIIRLKYAMTLLKANNQISEVAYQAGFSSASYFTKCFKEFYQENPTDFLKKNGRINKISA